MKRGLILLLGTGVWITAAISSVSQAAGPQASSSVASTTAANPSTYKSVVDKYCVSCHNERLKSGDLALDKLDLTKSENAEALEKIVRKLRSGQMPPIGQPRPDQ